MTHEHTIGLPRPDKPDDKVALDEVDFALRDTMREEAPAGFQVRVMSRLAERSRPVGAGFPWQPAFAAVVALTIGVAVFWPSGSARRERSASVARQIAAAPSPSAVRRSQAGSAPQTAESGPASAGAVQSPPLNVRAGSRRRPSRTASQRSTTTQIEDTAVTMIDPLAPPAAIPKLSVPTPPAISIDAIVIPPLEVAPLTIDGTRASGIQQERDR